MKTAAVISEYNPFHNGHQRQLRQIREKTGADYVVVFMSGDFVQRGAPAALGKYERAFCALSCGADMVIELPVIFALGDADAFAFGGAAAADALGIDVLCFGCEDPSAEKLHAAALLEEEEGPDFRAVLKEKLREGLSFAAANAAALSGTLCRKEPGLFSSEEEAGHFLRQPNNILAAAYTRALLRLSSDVETLPMARIGSSYHDLSLAGNCPSASAIRSGIAEARKKDIALSEIAGLPEAVPNCSFRLLQEAQDKNLFQSEDDYSTILFHRLEKETVSSLSAYGIRRDIAARILSSADQACSFSQLIRLVKNKSLTYSSISRTLFRLLLDLPFSSAEEKHIIYSDASGLQSCLYAHILGIREEAQPLLSAFAQKSRIPLIVSPAADEKRLSPSQQKLFSADLSASRLYNDIAKVRSGILPPNEYRRKFLRISPEADSNV